MVPNRNYSLDLTFTNLESIVFEAPDAILRNFDCPHPSATFTISTTEPFKKPVDCDYYDFNNADYTLLNEKLNEVNWIDMFLFRKL